MIGKPMVAGKYCVTLEDHQSRGANKVCAFRPLDNVGQQAANQ